MRRFYFDRLVKWGIGFVSKKITRESKEQVSAISHTFSISPVDLIYFCALVVVWRQVFATVVSLFWLIRLIVVLYYIFILSSVGPVYFKNVQFSSIYYIVRYKGNINILKWGMLWNAPIWIEFELKCLFLHYINNI